MLNAKLRTPPSTGQWKRKEVATNYHCTLELSKSVSDKRVQQLYSQDQTQEVIDQAKRQAVSARQALENIQSVEDVGLGRNSPNYPGTPRVNNRHRNAKNDMWVSYRELHEQTTHPVQVIGPKTKRYQSPEAETALVYPIGDCEYHYPIMHMVHSALKESWDNNPNNSIIVWTRLNISPLRIFRELRSWSLWDVHCRNTTMAKTTWSFRC